MKISGKELTNYIYLDIQKKLNILKNNNIIPKLIIIKSSNLASVNNYIGQKIKIGQKVGIKVEVINLNENECSDRKQIEDKIIAINKTSENHGIIFQKPSNVQIDEAMEKLIGIDKDVDGFLENSLHKPPVYRGVLKVLEKIYGARDNILILLLKKKKIVLLGKGKTGGQTIISGLKKDKYDMKLLHIIDTKTIEVKKKKYVTEADIILSAVGKNNPVDYLLFSKNSILIDIGVHFDSVNKIKGDFNEEDVKKRVEYYTTTPGGIGAMTVAFLMDNVVNSAMNTLKIKENII